MRTLRSLKRAIAVTAAAVVAAGTLSACSTSESSADSAPAGDAQRVVVTSLASANVLDDLDLEDRVVGITKKTPLPAALQAYSDPKFADVGSLKDVAMPTVAELEPDLVTTGRRTASLTPEFEKIADRVLATDPDPVALVADNRRVVTELAGQFGPEAEERAGRRLDDIDRKVADVRSRASSAGTAIVIMTSGAKVTAYGPGSTFDMIYSDLGFAPAAGLDKVASKDSHGAPVSWEQIAEFDADHVFVIDRDSAIGQDGQAAAALLDNPVFKDTQAAKRNQVHYLDAQNWYLVTGGLSVLEAMIDEIGTAVA